VKGAFFLRPLNLAFEQDVKVTTVTERDVPIEVGDDVIVQVRATVTSVIGTPPETELDLGNVRPHKIVQVLRLKARG
jgi:hypothetical protein